MFLDRDGTINADRSDYVKTWAEFTFLPRVIDALTLLGALDADIVVVTNQSAIGRGINPRSNVDEISRRMTEAIEASGGRIDAVYLCPHTPEDRCGCRKPAPGLLLRAATERDLDLSSSFMIGDRMSDVEAGLAAGCRCILLAEDAMAPLPMRVLRASNLYDAACVVATEYVAARWARGVAE